MGTTTLMTFEEFLQVADDPGKTELLEGELVRMPPPKRRDMKIAKRLTMLLDAAVQQVRASQPDLALGEVEIEMGYLLTAEPRSFLRPDVSITQPGQPGEDYYQGSPLFVFEVISPDDRAADLNRKVHEFLAHGAAEVWLIYPEQRQAWVHVRGERTARLEDEAIHSSFLPGVEIPFTKIFE